MDQDQSLALFAQGRDFWNAWAAEMVRVRKALEGAGDWTVHWEKSEWNDATRVWHAEAKADFSGYPFNEPVDFTGFIFPGDAWFREATFEGDAAFHKATFEGDAAFDKATFNGYAELNKATFKGYAGFGEATFKGYAGFSEATFNGDARFGEATFESNAWFGNVTFKGYVMFTQAFFGGFTVFERAHFKKIADFLAIDGKSAFSLAGASFLAVPDFGQAHFLEAPRLDNTRVAPRGFWQSTPTAVKAIFKLDFKGDPDLPARWRALKRLAIQGHDHERELAFFKGELKSRRWTSDKPWQAVFWFGLFYGWLSDFGRSMVRPLLWWAASALAFAPLYLAAHFERAGMPFSGFGWVIDRFLLQPLGAAVAPPLHCLAGSGDPWWAALGVSARKALLIFGLDASDKLTLNYACLYDVISQSQRAPPAAGLPARFYLDVPSSVIAYGVAQHILSAALLFLFFLAVRNHFRIK